MPLQKWSRAKHQRRRQSAANAASVDPVLDIGFFEMAVVAVVALFVVGPERLPGLVRTGGYWFGKIRYWVNNTKSEMKREFHNAEVLRQETEQKIEQSATEALDIQAKPNEINSANKHWPPKHP